MNYSSFSIQYLLSPNEDLAVDLTMPVKTTTAEERGRSSLDERKFQEREREYPVPPAHKVRFFIFNYIWKASEDFLYFAHVVRNGK